MCHMAWKIPFDIMKEFVCPMMTVYHTTLSTKSIIDFFEYYYYELQNKHAEECRLTSEEFKRFREILETMRNDDDDFISSINALRYSEFEKYSTKRTEAMLYEIGLGNLKAK